VLGVADASFHNFIVRQCLEAAILGSVAAMTLFIVGFEYFLGVGVLMGLAALVPIVGYPVGLLVGGLMVVVTNPWYALIYIIVVAVAQVLEATFVLPHIGDPRTVLPPVWTTVGVTIGGGVAGFVGMLVAIPTASTIRQLILIDVRRRKAKQRAQRGEGAEAATQEELPDVESKTHPVASVELSDTEL
jgi:predicted PurR-regulated permease PerM